MGLASLDAALAGLRVSQQQLSVISNNVANVGTPGFTRKILPQASQAINGRTVGVTGETIIRKVDINLSRDLWTQVSAAGELDVKQSFLRRVEEFHGPPDKEFSVAAEMGRLEETFIALADSPDDSFFLSSAVDQAADTAGKINDLADLIVTLRNDAQTEMENTIENINGLLEQIRELNLDFQTNEVSKRTTALISDRRDEAVKQLAELIDISFFTRGDGVMVVQSNQGQELVSSFVRPLVFAPSPLSPQSYYPVNVAGVFVGDPATDPAAFDITPVTPGGRLGGLIELRDTILPKQSAQIDELAHKLALRFDQQGLRLFTDASGTIPADTAPDPTPDPLIVPLDPDIPTATVEYIGFAQVIQVNAAIIATPSLIQTGTVSTDNPIPIASNEVVTRVLEFVFGDISFQQAIGAVDLRASSVGDTLQEWIGIFSENTINGNVDLTSFTDPDGAGALTAIDQLISASGGVLTAASEFNIVFSESRIPAVPANSFSINVPLAAVAAVSVGGETAAQLFETYINAAIALALPGVNPLMGTPAVSISSNGELVIDSRCSIEINGTDAAPPPPQAALVNPIGQLGLSFLGLPENAGNAKAPTDPYFDVKVGNDSFTRVFVEPGDTEVDLVDKLDLIGGTADTTGVPSLAVDRDSILLGAPSDGFLRIRPGDDYTAPRFGGSLQLVSGPFVVNAAAATVNAQPPPVPPITGIGPGTLADGINIVSALFGSFNAGPPVANAEPVSDSPYGSETNGALAAPVPTLSFRETLLGPGANISSNVNGASRLIDYSQRIVNEQTQELSLIHRQYEDEISLRDALQTRLLNESGVNLDEELGTMIVVQTAFAAAARVVSVVDEMFEELLNAF